MLYSSGDDSGFRSFYTSQGSFRDRADNDGGLFGANELLATREISAPSSGRLDPRIFQFTSHSTASQQPYAPPPLNVPQNIDGSNWLQFSQQQQQQPLPAPQQPQYLRHQQPFFPGVGPNMGAQAPPPAPPPQTPAARQQLFRQPLIFPPPPSNFTHSLLQTSPRRERGGVAVSRLRFPSSNTFEQ